MNGISFHEDNEYNMRSRATLGIPESSGMIRFLLRNNLAKDERQANYILIGVILVTVIVTVFLLQRDNNSVDYVIGADGVQYSADEYIELLKDGRDVLDPRTFE